MLCKGANIHVYTCTHVKLNSHMHFTVYFKNMHISRCVRQRAWNVQRMLDFKGVSGL